MSVKQIYFSDEEIELLAHIDRVRGGKSVSSYIKELIRADMKATEINAEIDRLKGLEDEIKRLADLLGEAIRPQFVAPYMTAYPAPIPPQPSTPQPTEEKQKLGKTQKKALNSIMALAGTSKSE